MSRGRQRGALAGADLVLTKAPIRYRQEGDAWWAEDDDMPGWTGAAESLTLVIQMHHDAKLVFPLMAEAERLRASLDEAAREVERLRQQVETLTADVALAANFFTVPLPEPGSDMARVLVANRLVRERAEKDEAALATERARSEALRATVQHVADDILGPNPPSCDGCSAEVGEALRLLREALAAHADTALNAVSARESGK